MTQKLNFIRAERPTTFSTTMKLDLRTLATLSLFWEKQGEPTRSAAELLRLSVETFRDVVTKQDPTVEVLTTQDAINVVKATGIADPLASNRRNRCNLTKQLSLESSVLSGYQPAQSVTKHSNVSTQQVALAKAQLAQLMADTPGSESLEQATQRRQQELANACSELLQVPEAEDE